MYAIPGDAGLEILAFPCNQFGDEEPGSNKEIEDFVCTRFKSEFPIFDKVNPENNVASTFAQLTPITLLDQTKGFSTLSSSIAIFVHANQLNLVI